MLNYIFIKNYLLLLVLFINYILFFFYNLKFECCFSIGVFFLLFFFSAIQQYSELNMATKYGNMFEPTEAWNISKKLPKDVPNNPEEVSTELKQQVCRVHNC